MPLLPSVKNLIFDLGGVILDLSVTSTIREFSKLSGIQQETVMEIFNSSAGFIEYEKGLMDDAGFRNFLREVYRVNATDDEIDSCWNAMLLGIPASKLRLLTDLKKNYNVFLLSNTNEIHLRYINNVILWDLHRETVLDNYFHRAYYSQRMLKRKPEPEIYRQVLEENGLVAAETLFLDDNILNIEGAKSVGVQTVHITSSDHIFNVFNQ